MKPPLLPFEVIKQFFLGNDAISQGMAFGALDDIEKEMTLLCYFFRRYDGPGSTPTNVLEFKNLHEGDIVMHVVTGQAYVITAMLEEGFVATRTLHITNLKEWNLVRFSSPPEESRNKQ
jgi:hypothetical protein